MFVLIKSLTVEVRERISRLILLSWGVYMLLIVPVNHFIFPSWYHGNMGIPFGDAFDIWAVWLIGAYSIGLGVGCFIAARDPMRYYATVMEILFGTFAMALVCIGSIFLLGTDPNLWTTWTTGILLIIFCFLIILVYPLTPINYVRNT